MTDIPLIILWPGMNWQHPDRMFVIANNTAEPMYIDPVLGSTVNDVRTRHMLEAWKKAKQENDHSIEMVLSGGMTIDITFITSFGNDAVSVEFGEEGLPRSQYELTMSATEAIRFAELLMRLASPPKQRDP